MQLPKRFCYYVLQNKGFKEIIVCVIVSAFLIFMFDGQLLLMGVFNFSAVLSSLCQKTKIGGLHYKSLKS